MGRKSKKAVREAITDSGGIVLEIARRLDVSWATAKAYVEKWDDTKALFDDEAEKVLDIAEQTIVKSIKGGDTSDAKWLLSRKGKQRGYESANGDGVVDVNVILKKKVGVNLEDV